MPKFEESHQCANRAISETTPVKSCPGFSARGMKALSLPFDWLRLRAVHGLVADRAGAAQRGLESVFRLLLAVFVVCRLVLHMRSLSCRRSHRKRTNQRATTTKDSRSFLLPLAMPSPAGLTWIAPCFISAGLR